MNVSAEQIDAGGVQACQAGVPPAAAPAEDPADQDAVVVVDERDPTWVTIHLTDDQGFPASNAEYRVELPDGGVIAGRLDVYGRARVEGIKEGQCKVTFPGLDGDDWRTPEA